MLNQFVIFEEYKEVVLHINAEDLAMQTGILIHKSYVTNFRQNWLGYHVSNCAYGITQTVECSVTCELAYI